MAIVQRSASDRHMLERILRRFVEAAVLAPSGDNTQPWQFALDTDNQCLTVRVDEHRDRSPMNANQTMARVAVGAAVENIVRTAEHSGVLTSVTPVDEGLTVVFHSDLTEARVEIDPLLRKRCTNRKPYTNAVLPAGELDRIRSANHLPEEVSLHWIVDGDGIEIAAEIISRTDAALFSHTEMRQAFLDNVRFDCAANEVVDEGLSLGSLEISGSEEKMFRMLPKMPNWLLNMMRIGKTFSKNSKKLIRSASGICVGTVTEKGDEIDFAVGRAMQSTWLTINGIGLAVQPMMSIPVLENAQASGFGPFQELSHCQKELGHIVEPRLPSGARIGFLLRFGIPVAEPSVRTGRRDISQLHIDH